MGFKGKSFFTVVEFGTSKISVVHCTTGKNGEAEIIGFSSKDSNGAIIKGDVIDVRKTEQILSHALNAADESVGSYFGRGDVYFLISGRGISSLRGEGCVMLYDENRTITQEHIKEADEKAQMGVPIPPDKIDVDRFTSYYVLDNNIRVRDPLNHTASRLDSVLHIIMAEQNKRNTIREILHEAGFEGEISDIFSGVASAYGTLSRDERENGVLMIDIGAGKIDYLGIVDDGVVVSGVLPVGMDNLANDLSIGLDLPFSLARRLLYDGRIEAAKNAGEAFLEIASVNDVVHRDIPIASVEKIINLRLQETFTILKEMMENKGVLQSFQSGLVLTGGGAKIPSVSEFASGVLGCHKRIASAPEMIGMTQEMKDPRYAAILGSVRYIEEMFQLGVGLSLVNVADVFENIAGGLMDKMKKVTKVFSK